MKPQIIALVSQKGGSGKTTTATNLAVAAVEAGKSALIVDLDPQASATGSHAARKGQDAPGVLPTHHAALPQLLQTAAEQGVDFVFIDTAARPKLRRASRLMRLTSCSFRAVHRRMTSAPS